VRAADSNVRKAPPLEKPEKLTARLKREHAVNGREPAAPAAA
jgi:hypothetical protein